MKKQVLLLFAAFAISQAAFAYDFSAVAPSGQTLYYNINGGEVTVTYPNNTNNPWGSLSKPVGELIIPDTVTYSGITYSITRIGDAAFFDCSELTSVATPTSVTYIGSWAFYQCCGLTSVAIPTSVTYIGTSAFYSCSGLTSMTIPNSVTHIMDFAFADCSGLTSMTIPNTITEIKMGVFRNCSGLTSVTIPNSVTNIQQRAFQNCSGLTSVTITDSITRIRDSAFAGCSGMTSIRFMGHMPPQLDAGVFEGIPTDIPVHIPCGRIAYYVASMPNFSNFVETLVDFSAESDNESMGTVQILTAPSCTDHNAVLNAVPADGYRFDHWSTGSTENPYTLTVTSDTTIIAYFVSNQGIGETGTNDIHISVFNGRVCVEGITNEEVRVYDITGRMVQNQSLPSGVYIVKVGTLPAQKVVVMR